MKPQPGATRFSDTPEEVEAKLASMPTEPFWVYATFDDKRLVRLLGSALQLLSDACEMTPSLSEELRPALDHAAYALARAGDAGYGREELEKEL